MGELTAKNFAENKVLEIIEICDDIKYMQNKQLRIEGVERIKYLANGIMEHLEYLDVKQIEEE